MACMVSVAARRRCSTSCKTASCSEYQQRNTDSGQKTDQQFHLELLEEWRRWLVSNWLADGGNEKLQRPVMARFSMHYVENAKRTGEDPESRLQAALRS
ncbi:hypothetical protein [Paraburkholderia sp. C35]|uniref:hypothetical protein n=1 Tax=Paraburkholderia sp. C35 TaxID=2126993 RepID=UPI0013A56A6C|nr:hypothetical protein [Paraburkholderia sp. C35]